MISKKDTKTINTIKKSVSSSLNKKTTKKKKVVNKKATKNKLKDNKKSSTIYVTKSLVKKSRGRKPINNVEESVELINSYDKFQEFFNDFCSNNYELIESYEEMSNVSFYSLKPYIYQSLQDINKENLKYDNVLISAIHSSLGHGTSIIEEIERYSQTEYKYDKTTLQRYFDDVGRAYDRNNNNFDIEYSLENRDKIIEMNLKNVITIAKKFRGNRLSLEELISAGNEGLCVAFNKYDPSRQKLRNQLIEQLECSDKEEFTYEEVVDLFKPMLSYGNIKATFNGSFAANNSYNKKDLEMWVSKNVRPAKFNSIAVMWITAYIIIELDNFSRIIKKPKKEIKKEKTGESPREVFYDLSKPVSKDGTHTLGEILEIDDDTVEEYEVEEAQIMFRDVLQILLDGIKLRNKRITLQRFGIGLPRPMSPKEISQREHISIARVSQIIQMTLEDMRRNYEIHKDEFNPNILYEFLERCNSYI